MRAPNTTFRIATAAAALLALIAAGCSDSDHHAATPTAGSTASPTPIATGTALPTPVAPATHPPKRRPVALSACTADDDSCSGTYSSLFAIAHSYNDPLNTVLYRVTVPSWSTGSNWGDGTNGFFYQATVTGNTPATFTYVPFNGMAVDSDGDPALPQFTFIVPVDVSAGTDATTLTITACASDEAGSLVTNSCGVQEYTPTCSLVCWSDGYTSLTLPTVGSPPSSLTNASLEFSGTNTVSIQNTGVYPGALTFSPQTSLSSDDETWLYDHLVFFDTNSNPYTNDILDDCSHPSIGVLTIDEAAYAVPSQAAYRTKYGDAQEISSATSPDMQFFFYTWDRQQTTAINVGAQFIYDASSECPGWINGGPGSIASTCNFLTTGGLTGGAAGLSNISPYAQVIPVSTAGTFTTSPSAEAGTQEIRNVSIAAEQGVSLCQYALNPLAINASGSAYNPPDYVIDDSAGDWDPFPQGLSYIVPSGFGTCTAAAPFCDSTADYVAYVPHYADSDGNFGTLNGGSTSQPLIGSFSLADEYALGDTTSSSTNTLQWFDNCGYGHSYEESADTNPKLGTRKQLPSPPHNTTTYLYLITNDLEYPIAFGKDCCASWYQENDNLTPAAWEPPVQIDLSYAAFIAPGQTLTYETLFSNESMRIYDASTGTPLFKLRLSPSGGALFDCSAADWSASITGSGPYVLTIAVAGAQSLACGDVGTCPFGLSASSDDAGLIHCTATASSFVVGMSEWASATSALTDSVQVRAWGGVGRAQNDAGGAAGFALSVLTPADLTDSLYVYVGENDGSSTVVTTQELSALTSAMAADVSDPATVGVLLIAGGGGGAASNSLGSGAGGAGAVAIANADPSGDAMSVAGHSGNSGGGEQGGDGGNASGLGEGGDVAGADGIGGFSADTMWDDSGSMIPPQTWSAGSGPDGSSLSDGQGGGGFGSGGHGHEDAGGAGGGGGGGSWATANTAYDETAPSAGPESPAGNDGAFEIVFALTDASAPAACSADSSAGTVTCTLGSTASSADLTAVLAIADAVAPSGWVIDDDTPMWIRAWGGAGGDGENGVGKGGAQGVAQTLVSVAKIQSRFGTTAIHYYVGQLGDESHQAGKGGSSTIVSAADLSSESPCLGSSSCTQNIVLIAGGGGGGAAGGSDGGSGSAGGAGGTALATTSGDATGPGGASDDAGGGSAGSGGSKGGAGDGGSSGSDGPGGLGGPVHVGSGASTSTEWVSTTQPSQVGSSGEGGEGRHDEGGTGYIGGGGGGGWGGGGGGGAGGQVAHGGGGGGSYAIAATQSGSVPSETSASSNGAVEIGFLVTAQ